MGAERKIRIGLAALFFVTMLLAFSGVCGSLAGVLPGMQFAPALMRCLTAFSAGALAAVLGIAAVTICFGRFYCAVFCPLGIFQDVIGFLSRRKSGVVPNFRRTRYLIAAVAYGMLNSAGIFCFSCWIRIRFSGEWRDRSPSAERRFWW